jgi:hypothetical protein
LVSVGLDGMLHGDIQHLFFVSRDSDVARLFGWKPTAINDFAICGHDSSPVLMLAHSIVSFSDKFNTAAFIICQSFSEENPDVPASPGTHLGLESR